MRFATAFSLPALTLPIINTARPPEVSFFNTSFIEPNISYPYSTLLPRDLPPGPYLPDPPWPIPSPGTIGCYAVDDGAYNIDVGIALIALQMKGAEPCRIDDDEFYIQSFDTTYNATERRCKTLHAEGTAAMSMCGAPGWGFTCGEMARLFERIYVPCRLYVNESWRITGQLTMDDGGWLAILPLART